MSELIEHSFLKVERIITIKGFIFKYKENIGELYVKTNFKFGFFLRKMFLFLNNKIQYTFKQENFKQQLLLFLIPGCSTESIPIFHLYERDKEIAQTSRFNNNKIKICFSDNVFIMQKIGEKNCFRIEIYNDTKTLIAVIKKNKLREGKKNIYDVFSYKKEILDYQLLLLLTAFSDFVFFPENNVFSWNILEYNRW